MESVPYGHTRSLEAVAEVFFEQGYAATSIDAIIERIGGSKRNIYSEFGSKEGVFTALVSESADAALAPLSVERFAGRSLSEILLEFGRRLLAIHMSPALIGVYRSIMTEALRFPELAKAFYDKGPGRASDRLADVLEEAKAGGEIQLDDCHSAADHFVGMLRDNLHLRVILGLRPPPSPAEAEAAVASGQHLPSRNLWPGSPACLEERRVTTIIPGALLAIHAHTVVRRVLSTKSS